MTAEWTPPPFGSPVWFDIPAVDVVACKKFYAALFPTWTWRPATEAYPVEKIAMFAFGEGAGALNGGVTQVPSSDKKGELNNGVGVTLYHLVASVDETKNKIEELGGTIVKEKTKEGESGWYMYAKDPEGNRFGIYQFGSG